MEKDLVIVVGGFILFVFSLFRFQKTSNLHKLGIKTNGVIIKNNYKNDNEGGSYYPVVRFLTKDDVWVTQELAVGYSPKMRQGKKVELIYDPNNPSNVEISSKFNLFVFPLILVLISLITITVGMLKYLEIDLFN